MVQKTFKAVPKMSIDDWRYSDQKMKVREQALRILLSKFGGQMDGVVPKYSSQSIYENSPSDQTKFYLTLES